MKVSFWLSFLLMIGCLTVSAGLAEAADDSATSNGPEPILSEEARLIYNEAVALFNAGHGKEALPKLKRVTELAPEYAPACSVYGSALMGERRYSEAVPVLKKAIQTTPDWINWYNLGVCYQQLGDLPNMANAFKNAVKISPDHPQSAQLKQTIKFLEAQIGDSTAHAGSPDTPDYLSVMEDRGFARWPSEKMPLRVFIKDGSSVRGFRPELVQTLKRACAEWSNASEGHVRFAFETDAAASQIVCSWTDDPKDLPYAGEAGHAVPLIADHNIQSGSIVFCTVNGSSGKPASDEDMYSACLHELGHVLGIGHSPNPQDVMFLSLTGVTALSSRDKKTIIGLYTMDKARLEKKPLDATGGVQAGVDSGVDVEVLKLGNAASEDLSKGNYKAAQEKLNKALQLKPGDDFIVRNLCIAYYNEATAVAERDSTKAEPLLVRARDFCKGTKNTDILKAILTNLSAVLKDQGKMQEAKTVDAEIAKLTSVALPATRE